jgi:hypothetical protein
VAEQIDDFFADFRAGLTPEITPPGPVAVRAAVRRRRQLAATALVATAAVLVAVPVTGYAAIDRGDGPDSGSTGTPAPVESSATPTPPPTPSPSTTTPSPAPDGRIGRVDLLKARVDLPEWGSNVPCADRGADLTDAYKKDGDNVLKTVEYGDVDHDGAQETITMVTCVFAESGVTQVVVFDRNAARKIVTLGRVVVTDLAAGTDTPEKIGGIPGVEARTDGTIRVTVQDLGADYPWDEEWIQRQTRTYAWDAGRFRQVGGPVRFAPNPLFTDLVVSVPDVSLLMNKDGNPYGTIVVTVRNKGPVDATVLHVHVVLRGGFETYRNGPGWADCSDLSPTSNEATAFYECQVNQRLAVGEERTLEFGVEGAATGSVDAKGTVTVARRVPTGSIPDRRQDDNVADFRLS